MVEGREEKDIDIPKSIYGVDIEGKDAESVLHILYDSFEPKLTTKELGIVLCLDNPLSNELLKLHADKTVKHGEDFDFSLRNLLSTFKLVGDASIMGKVLTVFSQVFYAKNASQCVFDSEDSCYITAYAMVLLNIDLHTSRPRKMTKEEFIRALQHTQETTVRFTNYIGCIYDSVQEKEITVNR